MNKETPVNQLMGTTLEKIREMVDTSTIIGEPFVTGNTTLIPVSKVSYGFTSGGADLPSKQNKEMFGGAGGGGISITPVSDRIIVIEINPRTSRSSALASKATGFPIALVSAMLAAGSCK